MPVPHDSTVVRNILEVPGNQWAYDRLRKLLQERKGWPSSVPTPRCRSIRYQKRFEPLRRQLVLPPDFSLVLPKA